MLDYISTLSWQAWTAIGVGAFMVAPRVVGGAIAIAIPTALAATAAVCLYVAGSTAIPMISGSWATHEASIARIRGYDRLDVRERSASTVCPRYHAATWIEQTVRAETRELAWCEAYPDAI